MWHFSYVHFIGILVLFLTFRCEIASSDGVRYRTSSLMVRDKYLRSPCARSPQSPSLRGNWNRTAKTFAQMLTSDFEHGHSAPDWSWKCAHYKSSCKFLKLQLFVCRNIQDQSIRILTFCALHDFICMLRNCIHFEHFHNGPTLVKKIKIFDKN